MYIEDNYSTNRQGREGKLGDDDDRTLVSAAAGCKSQLSSNSAAPMFSKPKGQSTPPTSSGDQAQELSPFCSMPHDWSRLVTILRDFTALPAL
jgi:hypothetical protein